MDPEIAIAVAAASSRGYAFLGAGLAAVGMGITALGLGNIFGNYLSGALRNPSAADGQRTNLLLGFALAEATGLIGFVVAMLILFV